MMASRLRLPQVFPTLRLAIAFSAGSLWFFAMPWGGNLFMWLGIAHNLALVTLAAIDYAWLSDSRECTISRRRLSTLSIGEKNPIWIEAAHGGRRPLTVEVRDEPPLDFEVPIRTVRFQLEPETSDQKNYKVSPADRGNYNFGDLHARYTTGLGLLVRQERVPSEQPVKVYPNIFQAEKHKLLARENRVAQMGLRRSKIHGQGQEFERLRDYMPDDSLRHVDWKATGRRNALTTREYDLEQSQNILILLDIGRNMASRTLNEDGTPGLSKADCAINASILLANVAAQSDDRVSLLCFAANPIAYVPPAKGAVQANRLLETLYPLQPRIEESDYYAAFTLAGHKQRKRSLVFLFTDLIDAEASQRLISNVSMLSKKHLVVCVALADYELPSIIDSVPAKASDLYSQTVALSMVRERRKALAQLAHRGILTIDATPNDLSVATVNKYLQLKREARI